MGGLRLCFVGPGDSITLRRWAGWFAARGHDTTVLTVEPASDPALGGLRQITLGTARGPAKLGRLISAGRLRPLLHRLRPDVVHAHYVRGLAWGLILARYHPCVVTPWGSDVLGEQGAFREGYSRWLTRGVFRVADLVTVHSSYMDTRVRPFVPAKTPVVRIGWGVNLRQFRPGLSVHRLRERWNIPLGSRVIFSPRLAQPFYN
ncbi:MAG: glycosyltransferase, partial [Nitrospirales bacterium]